MSDEKLNFVDEDYANVLSQKGLRTVKDFLSFKNDHCYKRNRYRAVYKIVLEGRKNVFLKKHDHSSFNMLMAMLFRGHVSEARKEFENIRIVSELGIRTMRAIGYGEKPVMGFPVRSFLLTESLEPYPRLEDIVAKKWSKFTISERQKMIDNVAHIVFCLHSHNFFHKDLYLGHILYKASDEESGPQFYLIDLQRITKHNIRLQRWRVKDLSSLNYSAELCGIEEKDRLRFLEKYCAAMKIDYKKYIRSVVKKTDKIKKHTLKKFLRNNLKKR